MMDVTVKTLDGQNKNYSVPENITVKEFKEKISNSINIPADTQRLIFQGRVMQDDKALREYDVHGKVIHVVQRPPPVTVTTGSGNSGASAASVMHTMAGAFTTPDSMNDPNQVQNIVQQVVNNLGDVGRDARVSTRTSADGSAVDVHINLGQLPSMGNGMSQSAQRLTVARAMLTMAQHTLDRLDDPNLPETTPTRPSEAPMTPSQQTTATTTTPTAAGGANPTTATPTTQSRGAATATAGTATPVVRLASGEVATLLNDMFAVNTRLQPYLERYRDLLRNSDTLTQEETESGERLVHLVTNILHYMSHCYHSLSDLTTDVTQAPPRYMAVPHHVTTAIIQQSFPIQAQINISNAPPDVGEYTSVPTPTTPATPATTTRPATTATQTTTTTAAPSAPPATTQQPFMSILQGQFGPLPGPQDEDWAFAAGTPNSLTITSDPVMFMEVGQDTVTVNSVTAEVTAMADVQPGAGGTTETSSQTQPPPTTLAPTAPPQINPSVMNSIMQMVTQSIVSAQNQQLGTPPGLFPAAAIRVPHAVNINMTPQFRSTPSGGQRVRMTLPAPIVFQPRATLTGRAVPTMILRPAAFTRNGTTTSHTTPRTTHTAPRTSHTSAQTTSSTGTRTSSSQQAAPPPPSRPIPAFDPFLPCNSHHVDPAMRPHHPLLGGTNIGDAHLSNMVSNLVNGLMQNSQTFVPPTEHQATGTTSTTTPQTQPPRTTTATTASAPTTTSWAPVLTPPIQDLAQSILTAVNRPGGTSTNVSVSHTPGSTTVSSTTEISDRAFTDLLQGIQASMFGQQPSESVASLLDRIGQQHNIESSDGLFGELFHLLSGLISIPSFLQIFIGQYAPLNVARGPLQEFIRARLLVTHSGNVALAVQAIIDNDITPVVSELLEGVELRSGVDGLATAQAFCRAHFEELMNFVLSSTDESSFGEALYNHVRRMVLEFMTLGQYALAGGQDALSSVIRAQMHHYSRGLSPTVQAWMEHTLADMLTFSSAASPLTDADIMRYVVIVAPGDEPRERKRQKVETDHAAGARSSGLTPPVSNMDIDSPTPSTSASTVQPTAATRNGDSDNWKSVLPEEWVPVISEDITRQATQAPQRPHSDAYMNGLPIKRRKVSKHGAGESVCNGATYLPDALKCAVASAQVDPITSIDRVILEASEDPNLQRVHEQQVEAAIANRLQADTDFDSARFPASTRVFKRPEDGGR